MFDTILPQRADNAYGGTQVALWLFALLLLAKVAMSLNCIFNGRTVATTADGIPLDRYTPAGAQAVVSLFAVWGIAQLTIGLLGALVLARYRSLVPLMFALILFEHASRKLTFYFQPIAKVGSPPGFAVNAGLFVLEIAGLALALWRPIGLR